MFVNVSVCHIDHCPVFNKTIIVCLLYTSYINIIWARIIYVTFCANCVWAVERGCVYMSCKFVYSHWSRVNTHQMMDMELRSVVEPIFRKPHLVEYRMYAWPTFRLHIVDTSYSIFFSIALNLLKRTFVCARVCVSVIKFLPLTPFIERCNVCTFVSCVCFNC